nr:MAG TPA: hypothetical protein [Caudoviricetes sp.]
MNFKIKEKKITILLSNKESVTFASDDNNTILKLCKSMNFGMFDSDILAQRKDDEWSDKQKMLLIKSLVATDNNTYKRLDFNNTYRRLNFYFQHREIVPSTGIYDCGIDPFDYKSAIGTVSFTDSNL